ncbi:17317_t:CDS:2, partial [Racocetra persica]
MSSHATLIVIIISKENSNSLTQGFAKYQSAEDDFKTVRWKYFYPFQKPYAEFSAGDIVMFVGKFIVESLEQYITVSHVNVIATGDSNQEFEANEIPFSISYCMFLVLVNRDPKEPTDIDFATINVNASQNTQGSSSFIDYCSDVDLIADDVEPANTRTLKRPHRLIPNPSKQDTSSELNNEETTVSLPNTISVVAANAKTIQPLKGKK